jgi:type I restriction enzyme S subunit
VSKWKKVRLGDVIVIDKKQVDFHQLASEYIYIGLEDIEKDSGVILNKTLVQECNIKSSKFLFSKNHILYGKLRPYLNKVARPDFDGVCSTDIFPILVTSRGNKNYIYHIMHSPRFVEYANSRTSGANLPRINEKTILEYRIPLPPLDIQKKISQELDTVSELLALRKQQLEELDQLIKSVFYEMFGDPVTNERGWEVKGLKSCATKIGSGATPRGGEENYRESGISLIRSLNVYDGFFKFENLAYIDDTQAELLRNVKVEEDDVLINITGASVARSCVVPREILPARVNQHVSIVRPKQDQLRSIYLNQLFIFDSYKKKLLRIGGSGGATREAITKQQLESLEIPLPPLSLQNNFADIVTQIESQKALVKKSIDETQLLFDSLMSKYFDD